MVPDSVDVDPLPVRHRTVVGPGGVRLQVTEVGASGRSAVVIAHGAGSSARFIVDAFVGPVLASGRRLVTFDLRGHGGSDPARDPVDHRLEVHVADLRAVATSVVGPIEVVGGVSLGGHAAVRAVATGDVACGVVLACLPAWTGKAGDGVGPHAVVAAEVREVGIAAVIARLEAARDLPPWLREVLVRDYRSHDPGSLTAALLALDGGLAPDAEEVGGLPVPLAAVGWPDDPGHPLAVARRWVDLAPVAALRTLELTDLDAGVDSLGRTAMAAVDAAGDEGGT
ncbi:MAG: alpha/beta hydrolase [Nitriliruptor sp.]|nr:MAG: alpha/beta hydrolase [Nitriliruptor sp.]